MSAGYTAAGEWGVDMGEGAEQRRRGLRTLSHCDLLGVLAILGT
jgi:hypothetical protein